MGFVALPTPRGLLLLFLAAAAAAVAWVNAGLITAFTAALLCAVVLSGFLMAQLPFAGLRLERRFPRDGSCGEALYFDIAVHNRLPVFRQSCVLTENHPFCLSEQSAFVIPPLGPRETFSATCRVKAEKRGVYFLEKVCLTSGDPLGLFRKKKCFHLPAQVEIHPRIMPVESLAAVSKSGGLSDPEGRNQGRAGSGAEFFGVRPYRIGDEVRHIHWKATAAKGRLMVKEFEASAVDQIVILLDTEKRSASREPGGSNFEFLVSCAASITEYLGKKYCHLRFAAAGKDGSLLHLTGDASSVRKKIERVLLDLQESDLAYSLVLEAVAETVPPRSIVYFLSMSARAVPDFIGILEEQDCTCFWIFAPPENFPVTEPDKPRIVDRTKVRASLPAHCMPDIADFATGPEILESRNGHEKI
ncbi:MAG: DUF58 domain-containing protein [Lentisphaeria bacterium]|nr:DUF58 domain-containing protein [Lentisphaeria bacterium]